MKNILKSISQDEKERILEMHRKATLKNYLTEQGVEGAVTAASNVTQPSQPAQQNKLLTKRYEYPIAGGGKIIFTMYYNRIKDNYNMTQIQVTLIDRNKTKPIDDVVSLNSGPTRLTNSIKGLLSTQGSDFEKSFTPSKENTMCGIKALMDAKAKYEGEFKTNDPNAAKAQETIFGYASQGANELPKSYRNYYRKEADLIFNGSDLGITLVFHYENYTNVVDGKNTACRPYFNGFYEIKGNTLKNEKGESMYFTMGGPSRDDLKTLEESGLYKDFVNLAKVNKLNTTVNKLRTENMSCT